MQAPEARNDAECLKQNEGMDIYFNLYHKINLLSSDDGNSEMITRYFQGFINKPWRFHEIDSEKYF